MLHSCGKIRKESTYKDGTCFVLDLDKRKPAENHEEEICLATRFLSMSSDKLHSQSKQELKNDLVKGDDKYLRSITAALKVLQYHSLHGHSSSTLPHKGNNDLIKTTFTKE